MPNKKPTTEQFIIAAKKIHGRKFDYSQTVYGKNNAEKVKIVCKEHGVFLQSPNKHLRGQGCGMCRGHRRFSSETWVKWAQEVHGDRYDYKKVKYLANDIKVVICCRKHGEFKQDPANHVRGHGCPKCKFANVNRFLRRIIKVKGQEFSVQGYEHHALRWMTKQLKIPVREIVGGSEVPIIRYTLDGIKRLHFPDFWIASQNRIVEVKSVWTLCGRLYKWTQIKAKRKAALAAGYLYSVLVFDGNGNRIKLPDDWFAMTSKEIKQYFKTYI